MRNVAYPASSGGAVVSFGTWANLPAANAGIDIYEHPPYVSKSNGSTWTHYGFGESYSEAGLTFPSGYSAASGSAAGDMTLSTTRGPLKLRMVSNAHGFGYVSKAVAAGAFDSGWFHLRAAWDGKVTSCYAALFIGDGTRAVTVAIERGGGGSDQGYGVTKWDNFSAATGVTEVENAQNVYLPLTPMEWFRITYNGTDTISCYAAATQSDATDDEGILIATVVSYLTPTIYGIGLLNNASGKDLVVLCDNWP